MRQQSFTAEDFEKYRKKTRKEVFLEEMDQIIPWQEMSEAVKPHYPAPKGAGRRPIGIERMLRIQFLQHWFELSDPGVEEALYDSRAMRQFVGIDLGKEPVPRPAKFVEAGNGFDLSALALRRCKTRRRAILPRVYSNLRAGNGVLAVLQRFRSSPGSRQCQR